MSDNETREPTPKGGESEPKTYTTIDEAQDALAKLSKEARQSGGVVVSRGLVDAIATAFERLVSEANRIHKRLGLLRGYMARYVDAVEREERCNRDAQTAYQEREVALAEMKRVAMEA